MEDYKAGMSRDEFMYFYNKEVGEGQGERLWEVARGYNDRVDRDGLI